MGEDHKDCALAIVGSLNVPRYAAESIIREALLAHQPRVVISGGATGVDRFAVEIGKEMGYQTLEFRPRHRAWDVEPGSPGLPGDHPPDDYPLEQFLDGTLVVTVDGGFKQRNSKVAETCDHLIRIASRTSKTYGSGWTADEAERLGKHVVRHTV